jgi:hypothetical protein
MARKSRGTGYYARKWAEVVRERYLLSHAETITRFLDKFTLFESKTGSVTIRIGSLPIPKQLVGDVIIRYLEKHNIPYTVNVVRVSGSGYTRRITVLDIPRFKKIYYSRQDKLLEELVDILEELEAEYSIRGSQSAKRKT